MNVSVVSVLISFGQTICKQLELMIKVGMFSYVSNCVHC